MKEMQSERVAIFGSGGQLGVELVAEFTSRGYQVSAFERTTVDITDHAQVEACISRVDPSLVINAAAYNQVDIAEQEPQAAFLVNALAVRNLALREAGYIGAGTCEFLVGADGTVSFLEVNTRLQVEHPVSEEVTGLDLVVEQLRIAAGERLGYDDPQVRGHSIEFRINGEDAGRGFLPAPGTVTTWRAPSGPGVRLDAGVEAGSVIGTGFDSLLAKLIVTGQDRQHALARARRALAEFEIGGLATVLPFHRAVLDDPAFAPADPTQPFSVHTRWIETEFATVIPPFDGPAGETAEAEARERVVVEVGGRRLEVVLPAGLAANAPAAASSVRGVRRRGVPVLGLRRR